MADVQEQAGSDEAIEAVKQRLLSRHWHPSEYERGSALAERWASLCASAVIETAEPIIAARVCAEAVAEYRADLQHRIEVSTRYENDRRVARAERDEYHRNWKEAEKRTATAVAEAVAEERQRLADAILPDHWQTSQIWGGVRRLACGRCRYGDGVCFLWPCPTRRALTGEPAPDPDSAALAAGSVPVAAPAEPVEDLMPAVVELRELWQRALEREGNLASAVADVIWKATPYGTTEDGDTYAYIVPKGCMHRLVGVAQQNGAHVPVAFRAVAAEPSVGTGTPSAVPTFEQLLRDPMEQFDRRSELLPAILRHLCTPDVDALMRSIEEYRNAPPATATSASTASPRSRGRTETRDHMTETTETIDTAITMIGGVPHETDQLSDLKDEVAEALREELDDEDADTIGLADAIVARLVAGGYRFVPVATPEQETPS